MDYMEWIPNRIAQLRMQKGISARDMSLSLGQSESYINKIENKKALPSMTGFLYICEYFEITPQEFFDPGTPAPRRARELNCLIERPSLLQAEHIQLLVEDLLNK